MPASSAKAGSSPPIQIRRATDHDHAFVIDSWSRESMANGWPRGRVSRSTWRSGLIEQIRELMQRGEVMIAEPLDVPGEIAGWICHENKSPHVIHYVYVKGHLRRMGVARALVRRAIGESEHVRYTAISRKLNGIRLPDGWEFYPFAAH